jgi:hypothetical protein
MFLLSPDVFYFTRKRSQALINRNKFRFNVKHSNEIAGADLVKNLVDSGQPLCRTSMQVIGDVPVSSISSLFGRSAPQQFRLFPADAGYRADIDGLLLDILFRCAVRVETFCLAVAAEAENIGEVVDAYSAADAHILVYKWFPCHINSPLFLNVVTLFTGQAAASAT